MTFNPFVAFVSAALSVGVIAPHLPASRASAAEVAKPVPNETVIARIDDITVTLGDIQQPLIDGYGLNVLLNVVQFELARQVAANAKVTVSEEDVKREWKHTLDLMFRDAPATDHDALFEQFLQNQRSSRAEFDIVMRVNAHLRKVAEPMLAGKISEENLKHAFSAMYGEKVQVRHIQGSNLQEIQEARLRIERGEKFEDVARQVSRNPRSAALGGLLPEFSMGTPDLPDSLKEAAFALKPGELSDPIEAKGAYHLLKLEQRIPPKVFKFEDVKDSIREDLQERAVQETVKQLRAQIVQQARERLKIEQPELKRQFDKMIEKKPETPVKTVEGVREALRRERERRGLTTAPSTTKPTTEE